MGTCSTKQKTPRKLHDEKSKAYQFNFDQLLVCAVKKFSYNEIEQAINLGANPLTNINNVPIFLRYFTMLITKYAYDRINEIDKLFNLLSADLDVNTKLNKNVYFNFRLMETDNKFGEKICWATVTARKGDYSEDKYDTSVYHRCETILAGSTLSQAIVQLYTKIATGDLVCDSTQNRLLKIVKYVTKQPNMEYIDYMI